MKERWEQLFEMNRGYARALAIDIAACWPSHVDRQELIHLAEIGLWQAAKRFDPTRGILFTTFAYFRVRGSVLNGLRRLADTCFVLNQAIAQLEGEGLVFDSMSTPGATAGQVSLDGRRARRVLDLISALGTVHLVASAFDGEDELDAEDPRSLEEEIIRREQRALVEDAWQRLPTRQRRVMEMIYEEHFLRSECAAELGVHKSQVTRDHDKAITSIRRAVQEKEATGRRHLGPVAPLDAGRSVEAG